MKLQSVYAHKLQANTNMLFRAVRVFMAKPTARRLVLGLFVLQAVFLVFTVRIGTPPDETNHIKFIEFYSQHSISPIFTEQQPTFNLGDKTREVDYLYHYGMSLVTRVIPASVNVERHMIRLFSVLVGLLTMLALCKLFRRLGISEAAITTSLLIITNLPMVLFMSSAINNDAFVWLGMAVGLLLLLRLWEKPRVLDLLWLANLVVAGGLVKRTLLPVSLLLGVASLIVLTKHKNQLFKQLKTLLQKRNLQLCIGAVILVISLGLFAERVGGNIVRYGGIVASCNQVQGEAACYGFWSNVRARNLANQPKEQVSPVAFVPRWFGESFTNVVDIQTQGWRHEVRPAPWLTPALVYLMFASLTFGVVYDARQARRNQRARWRLYVMAIAATFTLIQLVVNYGIYKHYDIFGIALNGRYILPSLLPVIGLAVFYWSKTLTRHPKSAAVLGMATIVAVVLASGLLMMVRNPQLFHG